jgi:hypothetical protein
MNNSIFYSKFYKLYIDDACLNNLPLDFRKNCKLKGKTGPINIFELNEDGYDCILNFKNTAAEFNEQKIVLEHTSANPDAGNLHIGNFANGLVGAYVANFLKYRGFKVDVAYYLNDRGQRARAMNYICNKYPDIKYKKVYQTYLNELKKDPSIESKCNNYTLLDYSLVDKCIMLNYRAIIRFMNAFNIYYDILYKESNYLKPDYELLLKNVYTENKIKYYYKNDKKIYLSNQKGQPLYILADVLCNMLEKPKYDKSLTILGRDQQLYADEIRYIISIECPQLLKKLEYIHIDLVKYKGLAFSKSKGIVLKVSDLKNYKIFYKNYIKIYLLKRVLNTKSKLDANLLKEYSELFLLDILDVEIRLVNSDIKLDTLKYKKFICIFRYNYKSYTTMFNEINYLSKNILNFFEYYETSLIITKDLNTLYENYNNMKNLLLTIVTFR